MKRSEELNAKAVAKSKEAIAIYAACKTANREPTAEEDAKFIAAMDEAGRFRTEAGEMAKREKLLEDDFEPLAGNGSATANRSAPIERGMTPGEMPRCYGRVQNFFAIAGMDKPETRALRFGAWLANSIVPDAKPWAKKLYAALDSQRPYFNSAHLEGSDTSGGLFVPPEFEWEIINLRETYGAARRLSKIVPMARETKTMPRRTSGLSSYFVGEGNSIKASSKTFDLIKLSAKKLAAIAIVSNELEADSVIEFADDIISEIGYAFSYKEDLCFFNGDGTTGNTTDYGGVVGVTARIQNPNNVAGGVSNTICTGLVAGSGSGWSGMVIGDFQKMIGTLPQFADTPNTKFVCHRTFEQTILQNLAAKAGGARFTEIIDGVRRHYFLGYEVDNSQVLPKTTVSQNIPIFFGDFKLATKFGDRRQTTLAKSVDATVIDGSGASVPLFQNDMMAIRGMERIDINVHDVGDDTTTNAQSANPNTGPALIGLFTHA